jgi:electron transport complex protein RnfC
VVAFTDTEAEATHRAVYPCIHCGYCVDACPMFLNPAELGLLARNGEFARMAGQFHLRDCFECGSCSFVCPSRIPLVQQFRMAKAALRKAESAA